MSHKDSYLPFWSCAREKLCLHDANETDISDSLVLSNMKHQEDQQLE
jgi:hypothetical protein